MKSKVQHLKDSYNSGEPVYLEEHEPNIVAGVLKQFLRELPEPILTTSLVPKFEEASSELEYLLMCWLNIPLMNFSVMLGQSLNPT